MWCQLLRDALLRVWPRAKRKIPWGLGLMPSPQPFLLATIVSAFVKPVLEVSNSLHASHPKLGCTAWLPRTAPLWHCLTRDQSASTALQRGRWSWVYVFFCIYYSCQKNSPASKMLDLFGHSEKWKVHRKTAAPSRLLANSNFLLCASMTSPLINNQINVIWLIMWDISK